MTLVPSLSSAKTCSHIFNVSEKSKVQPPINYSLDLAPKSKGNILLIHGLGDSLAHLQKISKELVDAGYTVLRVDLNSHGKNLENDLANQKSIPSSIPYEKNVADVFETVRALNFKNPIVIGHSYGGAIAHAVSNKLSGEYSARALIMMAPYLRRLDQALLTGNPIFDMQTEYMTEQLMRNTYREYFESQNRDHIDAHIESAIATIRGIRSFDILSYDKKASLKFQIPFLVIGGTKDQLVKDDQINSFHKKLVDENYDHKIVFIEGDHFFPQKMPKDVFNTINIFLNSL